MDKDKIVIKCSICGKKEVISNYIPETMKKLEKYQMCFKCNHWREQHELDINERGEHNYAIVNGTHYVLCPPTNSYFKGYGGRKFTFKFNDGTIKECNNVWCQGDVKDAHPHWQEIYKDNAVIL